MVNLNYNNNIDIYVVDDDEIPYIYIVYDNHDVRNEK